ncbi:hypothetical protein CgunFtcFv8_013156 [Champsocephalus gunnari]|uniref:Uncharacterized protein n=1 Tax=Champsocephalus gunnari TaxID=52237 RepID=A0AAN8DTK6_CHAGU|nr:hypothetical protein CgunFtcFv8_013156 [Champsocephalus gunnari]
MFSSHTHHILYNPRFISPDIHLYFIRSPWGPGGCNSSPRDTGLRSGRPSGPSDPSDWLGGHGLGGHGLRCAAAPGSAAPGSAAPGGAACRLCGHATRL